MASEPETSVPSDTDQITDDAVNKTATENEAGNVEGALTKPIISDQNRNDDAVIRTETLDEVGNVENATENEVRNAENAVDQTETEDEVGNIGNTAYQTETEDELSNVGNAVTEQSDEVNYTPLCSNEGSEKEAAFREYKLLERNIKHQNKILEDMKEEIQNIERKPCLTKCEKRNLKNMRDSYEREMSKLKNLINKAVNLQNSGSRRHYREFDVVTTFDEDNLNLCNRTYETLHDKTNKTHDMSGNLKVSNRETSEMNTSFTNQESSMDVCEEKKLMKEIYEAFKEVMNHQDYKQHKMKSGPPCNEKDSLEKIKSKIKCMQTKICQLSEDLNKRQKGGNQQSNSKFNTTTSTPAADPALLCLCKNLGKSNNFEQLKESYLYLLTEFNKKDEKLKDLTKRLRNSCSKCAGGAGVGIAGGDFASADESELHLLRNRINEMKEEQVEFKCLMKEQSCQLEEYRNKYLAAQQKVEEQCVLIEKLNMNNKCIERQINQEVKEIRAKFQERLADLLQFPKLLQNEQIKFSQACKEKEDLEKKLVILCKELKHLKAKQQTSVEDCKPQLHKCQHELMQLKKHVEEIQQQRDLFCTQLRATVEDLNTIRSESAKIIARTKERSEFIKQQQQDHIDRLEKQLAQCRATACLSVSDREAVIKEMQGQLNTMSYSFDAAQKQIKTLRNHIAFMSNENTFPKTCCD